MTGTTFGADLPFPEPTDPLATLADQVQALASAIYDDVQNVPYVLANANWTVQKCQAQPVLGGAFMFLIFDFSYVAAAAMTADVTADTAPGNITDKPIFTIGSAFRPAADVLGIPIQRPGVGTWWGSLQNVGDASAGLFKLTHGVNSGKIPAGNVTPVAFKVRHLVPRVTW